MREQCFSGEETEAEPTESEVAGPVGFIHRYSSVLKFVYSLRAFLLKKGSFYIETKRKYSLDVEGLFPFSAEFYYQGGEDMKKYVIQYYIEKGLVVERTVEANSKEEVADNVQAEQIVQYEDTFGELNLFNKQDVKLVKIKDQVDPVFTSRRGG
ncbi:hypothetical protein B0H99_101299 [Planomicrobium soli]|uniref:Uncharacterized protein n=2 Tax=Planomicrobium soli TaxID=1176648 RepID=A0A2P8H780_9BACL|nr:hypothetical protein B0H99_101299 [Planomicrobium soli]